jgi:hypothetical protein
MTKTETSSQTNHKPDCSRVFRNYDASCPRCLELISGSKPREGWQTKYFAFRAQQDEQRSRAIEAHFAPGGPHDRRVCGPVCTAFDW